MPSPLSSVQKTFHEWLGVGVQSMARHDLSAIFCYVKDPPAVDCFSFTLSYVASPYGASRSVLSMFPLHRGMPDLALA